MQHSHSRHQKTTSNLLRINLKGKLRFSNGWPLEGAMYINLWSNFLGHPEMLVFCNFFQNIGVRQFVKRYTQTPLQYFLIFTVYQNYTLALTIKLVFYALIWQRYLKLTLWRNCVYFSLICTYSNIPNIHNFFFIYFVVVIYTNFFHKSAKINNTTFNLAHIR